MIDTLELPMFPLGSVLLPGELLPLHVFEPRYRKMLAHCREQPDPCFGVVLIERGQEVGGGDIRRGLGTIARVVRIAPTVQGTLSVLAVGVARLEVVGWLDDAPYPRAEVRRLEDDPGEPQRLEQAIAEAAPVVAAVRRYAEELGDVDPGGTIEPAGASLGALIAATPLGQEDRYRLLGIADLAERAERFTRMVDDLAQILRFRLGLPNM